MFTCIIKHPFKDATCWRLSVYVSCKHYGFIWYRSQEHITGDRHSSFCETVKLCLTRFFSVKLPKPFTLGGIWEPVSQELFCFPTRLEKLAEKGQISRHKFIEILLHVILWACVSTELPLGIPIFLTAGNGRRGVCHGNLSVSVCSSVCTALSMQAPSIAKACSASQRNYHQLALII